MAKTEAPTGIPRVTKTLHVSGTVWNCYIGSTFVKKTNTGAKAMAWQRDVEAKQARAAARAAKETSR